MADIVIELRTGKKINLTNNEYEELKVMFGTDRYIPYPVYPTYPTYPAYPTWPMYPTYPTWPMYPTWTC